MIDDHLEFMTTYSSDRIGNFYIDVTAKGHEALACVINLAFSNEYGKSHVIGYRYDPKYGLSLYTWIPEDNKEITQLPFKMGSIQTVNFIENWLQDADFGKAPDLDGSVEKGAWRIYNNDWSIHHHNCTLVTVQPKWAEWHK